MDRKQGARLGGTDRKTLLDSVRWFKAHEVSYVQVDSCEVFPADGKLTMFIAIDRGL